MERHTVDNFPNPKQIVADGYNQISDNFTTWSATVRTTERQRYTQLILEHLPQGSAVLELGCGTGQVTTDRLAQRFQLTGVDIAQRQIDIARAQLPDATWLCADMTAVTFASASFDAVVAFYSIIHVPQAEQPALFAKIATWLRPGGLFVAALTATDTDFGYEEDWLGAPMFWSGFDSVTNIQLIKEAGLEIISAVEETEDEMGQPITFLWVVAQKGKVR